MKKLLLVFSLLTVILLLIACEPGDGGRTYEVRDIYLKGGVYQENSYIVLYYSGDMVENYEAKTRYFQVIITPENTPSIKIFTSTYAIIYLPKDYEIKPALNKN